MARIGLARRQFLAASGAAAIGAMLSTRGSAASQPTSGRRPNVIMIYTDDQPKGDFGCYGGIETPHIDKLAKEGIRFNRFYVSTALCAPSRFGLQNGCYASRAGACARAWPAGQPAPVPEQLIGDEEGRPPEKMLLPSTLKAAGYATGIVGKWHQGFMGERMGPHKIEKLPVEDPEVQKQLKHNFDLAADAAKAAGYDYADALYHDNVQTDNFPKCVRFHNQEWITDRAIKFIEQNKDKPFFLSFNPTLMHFPPAAESLNADPKITAIGLVNDIDPNVQPSRKSVLERAGDNARKAAALWLDDAIGALADRIEKLGLSSETLIILASDNGTGGKWTCYEGGANTGCIARWKGHIAPAVSEDLVQNVDIAPTIFEITGAAPDPKAKIDGISFAPVLAGKKAMRTSVYLELAYQRAVIDQDLHKYIAVRYPPEIQKEAEAGKALEIHGKDTKGKKGLPLNELHDLTGGKPEGKNLIDDPAKAEKLASLKKLMGDYCKRLPYAFGEFTQ